MNTGGWYLLALVVFCSGQVAWPVQSFSPEVARQLQAALSSMPAADIPTVLHLGAPSVASSVPTLERPAIPLSTIGGPREKLAPVVELPLTYQDARSPYSLTLPLPSALPQPWFAATPRTALPPAAPQALVEEPFYLTAATRLRLPSALYQQAVPVPYIPGFAGFLPPQQSFAHDSFALQAGPPLSPAVPYFYPLMNTPPPSPSEAKYSAPYAMPYPADPQVYPPSNLTSPASLPAHLDTYPPFDLLSPAASLEAVHTSQESLPSNPISLQFLSTHDPHTAEQSALMPGFSFESVRSKRRRF